MERYGSVCTEPVEEQGRRPSRVGGTQQLSHQAHTCVGCPSSTFVRGSNRRRERKKDEQQEEEEEEDTEGGSRATATGNE